MSFDIIKHRTWWFILSSVLVLASLISIFINGFNFGIDYTGGTILDMQFNKAVSVSEVRQVIDQSNLDLGNTVIQLTGVTDQDSSTDVMLRMRNLSSDETKAVSEKLGRCRHRFRSHEECRYQPGCGLHCLSGLYFLPIRV